MATIQLRRWGFMTAPVLMDDDSILGDGEFGYDILTGVLKVGDGKTMWKNLPSPTQPTVDYLSAAPTTGTYGLGSIIWNSLPVAGENVGWVCTVAGTPGTWMAFGTISI
jgi:hypothetical protein